MLRKGDVVLLLVVVFCVLAGVVLIDGRSLDSLTSWNNLSSLSNKDEMIAIIKKDDVIIQTINLAKINTRSLIKVSGQHSATIAVEHNKICFLDSTCPAGVCVKTGWITKAGDLAVCLPNRTIIKIQQSKTFD